MHIVPFPLACVMALGCLGVAAGGNRNDADDVVAGKIKIRNMSWQFPDGRIDWLFNPTKIKGPVNHEWTWQINRMPFWHDLAKAYARAKDEKYARAFARQLESWLDQTGGIPPEKGYWPYRKDSPWRTIEEGIRLNGSWAVAWDTFRASPAFAPELRQRFLVSMRAQARHLMAHRTKCNWLLMEMAGVYRFASKFPDYPESETFRRESARIYADAICAQVLPDGMQEELTPGYHGTVYGNAMPIYDQARASGHLDDLPPRFFDSLRLAAEGPIAMVTPAFKPPRFNDSCSDIRMPGMIKGATTLFPDRADFLWATSFGKKGRPPDGVTASRFLPWSGFAVMRTDWSRTATYLCFDVGPLGAQHRHQDKLSFVLWKGEEELVFDDGGGQYAQSPERRYGISGYDHSTLLVDGLAQYRKEPGRMSAPIDAGWTTTAARDRAFGVYDQGFGTNELKLATQRREIVFDKAADSFTVTDDIASADGAEHDYTLLFQLKTTNTVVSADGRRLVAHYGKTDLILSVGEGATVTTACGRREPSLAGWYLHYHGVSPATTAFVTVPRCKNRRVVTTLKPLVR